MTGHQKGILYVNYSPDGRLIVSCSLDKSAKLWDGRSGKYVHRQGAVAPGEGGKGGGFVKTT